MSREIQREQTAGQRAGQGAGQDAGPVGFLPAAGRGSRFGDASYVKELFPLPMRDRDRDGPGGRLLLRPVCERSLRAMHAAGAARCVVVVSPQKADILRALRDGAEIGLPLGYAVQAEPRGIPHALRCARPLLDGAEIVFALPDTVVTPAGALAEVQRLRRETAADLVLGAFPVHEPERLGPVELDDAGRVVRIFDKPGDRRVANSWGVACWSPRFTDFCCAWDEARERERGPQSERAIGHAFEAARREGLDVRARFFPDGRMLDIGTPAGLREALQALDGDDTGI